MTDRQAVFKAGLRWLHDNSPAEFQLAVNDLVMFGTAGVMMKADGTFAYLPMVEVMKIEKKEVEDAARTN